MDIMIAAEAVWNCLDNLLCRCLKAEFIEFNLLLSLIQLKFVGRVTAAQLVLCIYLYSGVAFFDYSCLIWFGEDRFRTIHIDLW